MNNWSRWLTRTTAATSVGVCVAVIASGWWDIVALAVPVTSVVAVAHVVTAEPTDRRGILETCVSVVRVSVCLVGVLVCVGLASRWHAGLALLVLLALLATTPPVRTAITRRTGPGLSWLGSSGHAMMTSRDREPSSLPSLTDHELRRAWEVTSRELRGRPAPSRCISVVITRQYLLDEIWSRDRAALETWAACGARADDLGDRYFDA